MRKHRLKPTIEDCMGLAEKIGVEIKTSFSGRSFKVNDGIVIYSVKGLHEYLIELEREKHSRGEHE